MSKKNLEEGNYYQGKKQTLMTGEKVLQIGWSGKALLRR